MNNVSTLASPRLAIYHIFIICPIEMAIQNSICHFLRQTHRGETPWLCLKIFMFSKKNMHMLRHHNVFTQPFDPQSNPINCPSTYEYIPIISPWLIGIVPSLFHYIPLFPHDIPIIGPHSPPHQSSRSGP